MQVLLATTVLSKPLHYINRRTLPRVPLHSFPCPEAGPTCPQFSSVQSLSRVRLSLTPWTAARHASLSITNSQSLPKLLMSMTCSHGSPPLRKLPAHSSGARPPSFLCSRLLILPLWRLTMTLINFQTSPVLQTQSITASFLGFPGSSDSKTICNAGDPSFKGKATHSSILA